MPQRKQFASFEDQVKKIKDRSLVISDEAKCISFLRRNSYYRFSGYLRYFQISPGNGNENFLDSSDWDAIQSLYHLDMQLRNFIMAGLQLVEIATRTAFAHSEAKIHSPYELYLSEDAYLPPRTAKQKPIEELMFSEIRRSEEPFIRRYRNDNWTTDITWMNDVPVWAATETFSFGTLSKAIAYRNDDAKVYRATCQLLNVSTDDLHTQLRAFTHLRNRCAHFSRLWNTSTQDQPTMRPKVKRNAKKLIGGQYDGNSILAVIIAIDDFLTRTKLSQTFLSDYLELTKGSEIFQKGIAQPQKPR